MLRIRINLIPKAVKEAVHRLGFTEVAEIRVGKYFEMRPADRSN